MAKRYVPGTTHIQDLWYKRDKTPSQRHKRGKRWRAFWVDNLGQEHTAMFGTKEEAKAHLADVTASLKTHTYVNPEHGKVTVGELVEHHLDAFVGKPKTLGTKRSLAKTQVLPRWQHVPVRAVEASDVRAWIAAMMRGENDRKPVSSKWARDAAMLLHAVLKDAVADRRIAFDPMVTVKLPSKGRPRDQYPLTIEEVYALADAMTIKDDDGQPESGVVQVDRALLLTLCFTGIRVGEALGLTASAVDFNRRRIHIRRTYGQDEHGRTIESTPKSHESRWVPIPAQLMGELLPLVEARTGKQDIFVGPRGGTVRADNWRNRVFTPALVDCDLYDPDSPRVVHDLRHTYASLAVRAGANVKALQRAMGHASASITLDVYSHLFDDDLEALGESLGKLKPKPAQPKPVRTHFVPASQPAS
ncbi:tyrosine-type recombinase/integrase [Nesterenkonia sphaerica]|nr:site-specific integrase [Nesterenkonia sphaerica]